MPAHKSSGRRRGAGASSHRASKGQSAAMITLSGRASMASKPAPAATRARADDGFSAKRSDAYTTAVLASAASMVSMPV